MSDARSEPFSAQELGAFVGYLAYVEKGLMLARRLQDSALDFEDDSEISTPQASVRWYAIELAQLESLMFRAAGLRGDEKVCYDAEIEELYQRLSGMLPSLRDLRNALFGHPPFVGNLVESDEVLFFSGAGFLRHQQQGAGPGRSSTTRF